jgi:hypothetical protein
MRCLSVAPHDVDGLLRVAPRNRYGLGGAARHIGAVGRRDSRRIAMRPVPGNVICIGVMVVARWSRQIDNGFAIRWSVGEVSSRPEGSYVVSPVMPERVDNRWMGHRMCRSRSSARRCSRCRECLVRGKHQRDHAERRDKRPMQSIPHDTHTIRWLPSTPQRTLGRACRVGKGIINC